MLVSEEERIPFLLAYCRNLKNNKIILFVATCDEVEYFFILFQQLKMIDNEGNYVDERFIRY